MRRDDDGKYGNVAIGVTTNPEMFMNAGIKDHPFKGKCVKHAICRINHEGRVMVVKDGKIKERNDNAGSSVNDLISLWIGNGKLKVYQKGDIAMCEEDLRSDLDGNMLNYYFAMTFTATQKKRVRFEISGDFV